MDPARLPYHPRSHGAPGRLTTTLRDELRAGRFLVAELAIAVGLLACGLLGVLPFGGTPVLVAYGALSLWARGEGPNGVGLRRAPPGWRRVVLLGLTAGLGYQLLSLSVVEPLTAHFIGRLPDVSMFASLEGNIRLLLVYLATSWTLAGFGEEFVYRGYLLSRIAQLFGGGSRAWFAALGATTVLFGLGHGYQGASGIIDTGLFGLLFGALYLLAGRNLWVPVIAHGVADTTAFALIFFGKYPGV